MKKAVRATPKMQNELRILHYVADVVYSGLELNQVLEKIVALLLKVAKADSCLLYLFDKTQGELILRASKNPHPDVVGAISMKVGEGITGWVAQTKKVVNIPRGAAKDPRFKFFHELPEDAYEAFLSVPIIYNKELVGVVNLQNKKPRVYHAQTVALVSLVASHVGGAIENARLFEEVKKKAQQFEQLSQISDAVAQDAYLDTILNSIVEVAARMVGAKICSLMMLDEKKGELHLRATQSESPAYKYRPPLKVEASVGGVVVREGRPIVVKDVQKDTRYAYKDIAKKTGVTSLLCVPMRVKNKIIGVLNVYTQEEHDFTDEEIGLMDMVADQVAVAIDKARLFEEAKQAKEMLEARKKIEKAKGILMRKEGLSEDEAYKRINKKSMDSGKPMIQIAEAIMLAEEIGL